VQREEQYEERFRAALDGLKEVGAGDSLSGITAPTSITDFAPVLELVDSRDLHSRGLINHLGPTPSRGTNFSPARNICDSNTKWRRKEKLHERINGGRKRNA